MESVEWPIGLDVKKASAAFKAYDIRGIAGDPLTPDFAYRLGRTLHRMRAATLHRIPEH